MTLEGEELTLLGIPGQRSSAIRLPDKAYLLITLLTLDHPRSISRAGAALFLWGAEHDSPLINLRQLLAQVRRWEESSGLRLLKIDNRTLGLTSAGLSSDLFALMHATPPVDGNAVRRVLSRFGRTLLEGISVSEDSLSRWLEGERESAWLRLAKLLLASATVHKSMEIREGLSLVQQHLPFDENILRARLRNLTALGHKSQAHKVFKEFSRALQDQLGVDPDLETSVLSARLFGIQSPAEPVSDAMMPPVETQRSTLPRIMISPPDVDDRIEQPTYRLAQSLVDDITLQLCRPRTFAMLAPYTARQLMGADTLSKSTALGLDYVVTSSVLPDDAAPRLAFALIQVATQQILMADQLPLEKHKLEGTQRQLVAIVAKAMSRTVAERELRQSRQTGAASAYVRFLLGSELMHHSDLASVRKARKQITQALKLQPDYVPALGAMARTLSTEWLILGRSERDMLREAINFAQQAVDIDPLNPTGHRELGHAAMYLGDLDESESHFADALDRAPHHADILADQADILVHGSRMRDAKSLIDNAIALNPMAPDEYRWISGSIEFFLGDYHNSLAQLLAMKDQSMVDRLIAASAAMAGEEALASAHRQRWMDRYPDFRLRDFAAFMPHRSKEDVDHFLQALAKAGFD